MAEEQSELFRLIEHGREERSLEYKGSVAIDPYWWSIPRRILRDTSEEERAKLSQARSLRREHAIRTIIAMANIGGGAMVLGMRENKLGGLWEPEGLPADVAGSWQQDTVQPLVNQWADPYVRFTLSHVYREARRYVVIQVDGFDDLPVVCVKDGIELRSGAIYTRPYGKHESRAINTQTEMREVLDRAIEKGVERELRLFDPLLAQLRAMLPVTSLPPTDDERFAAQRGEQ